MAKTQEAAVVPVEQPSGLAIIEPTPELVEQVRDAILNNAVPPEIGDPNLVARAIKERILAGTLQEALTPAESLQGWRDYMNEDVTVLGFHLNPSNIDNAQGDRGVYAVVEIMVTNTGEIVTVHCGGGNVLATLVRAWETKAFPFRCKLTEKGTGTSGRSVLWLEKV